MIAPAEPVLGRLPVAQISGAVADPAIKNEAQNNPPFIALEVAPQAEAAAADTAAQPSDSSVSAFPSLFLAQLMGQGAPDSPTRSVIASYAAPPTHAQPQAAGPSDPGLEEQFVQALKETQAGAAQAAERHIAPQVSQPPAQAVQAPAVPRKTQIKATADTASQSKKLQAYQATASRGTVADLSPSFA